MGRDGTLTRSRILDETKQLVLEYGFAGTTIDQILDRSGITKGAFFYHFKSKAALAEALIKSFAESDKAELEQALEDTTPDKKAPLDGLLDFLQWFIDDFSGLESPPPGCLYASYSYEPKSFGEAISKQIVQSIALWRQTFIELISRVMIVARPKKDVDISSLADQFVVIVEGALIVSRVTGEVDIAAQQLRHLKSYIELLFDEH